MVLGTTVSRLSFRNLKLIARWHGWIEKKSREHVKKLCNYKPTASDSFSMSRNAGRKPNFQYRHRNEPPSIVKNKKSSLKSTSEKICHVPSKDMGDISKRTLKRRQLNVMWSAMTSLNTQKSWSLSWSYSIPSFITIT